MKNPAPFLRYILVGALFFFYAAGSVAAETKTARLAYVKWSCATAATYVVKAVLKEELGYDVELIPVDAEFTWLLTAAGNVDGFVCAWLPSLHRNFYGKVEYNVNDLGPNLEGTRVGLVVPGYVTIDSVAELAEHAEAFGRRITGIDSEAGIMRLTQKIIEEYPLPDMELISGSGASMTESLGRKIENREWVVVTGWTPHWKFARWDLKYLDDPENIYGGSEAIHTVVRVGLKADDFRLYSFLDSFSWEMEDIHQVMDMIQKSGKPYESAVSWINQNPDKVALWLAE